MTTNRERILELSREVQGSSVTGQLMIHKINDLLVQGYSEDHEFYKQVRTNLVVNCFYSRFEAAQNRERRYRHDTTKSLLTLITAKQSKLDVIEWIRLVRKFYRILRKTLTQQLEFEESVKDLDMAERRRLMTRDAVSFVRRFILTEGAEENPDRFKYLSLYKLHLITLADEGFLDVNSFNDFFKNSYFPLALEQARKGVELLELFSDPFSFDLESSTAFQQDEEKNIREITLEEVEENLELLDSFSKEFWEVLKTKNLTDFKSISTHAELKRKTPFSFIYKTHFLAEDLDLENDITLALPLKKAIPLFQEVQSLEKLVATESLIEIVLSEIKEFLNRHLNGDTLTYSHFLGLHDNAWTALKVLGDSETISEQEVRDSHQLLAEWEEYAKQNFILDVEVR